MPERKKSAAPRGRRKAPSASVRLVVPIVLALACCALLGWLVVREQWITDDALISFRYVDNLLAGKGLVFNQGEHVEAFTSPLFVALLAPLRGLGANPFAAAQALGALFTFAELALLLHLLWKRTGTVLAPAVAGALFCTDRVVTVWATGGLETSLHSLLLFAAFAFSVRRRRPGDREGRASAAHVLLAAARPEGLVFYPLYLVSLVRCGWADGSWRGRLVRSLVYTLPAVGLLVVARYAYYGSLLPHSYAAKMSGVPTAEFGVGYVAHFAVRMGFTSAHLVAWLGVVAVLALGITWAWRKPAGEALPDAGRRAELRELMVMGVAYVALGTALAALEGGDYMTDFRFLRPVMGIFYATVATAIAYGWVTAATHVRVAAVAASVGLLLSHGLRQSSPTPMYDDAPPPEQHKTILTVTAERASRFRQALDLVAAPGDSLLTDWTGFMGYGHEYRTVDCTGLTSPDIEGNFYLRPLRAENGRRERLPGHARWPEIDFLRASDFTFIFPKVSSKGHEEPEVHEDAVRRHRLYPFLHVTMGIGRGEYFRFFTTLSADELEARASERGLDLCWRPPKGELHCAGQQAPPPEGEHGHAAADAEKLPPGVVWRGAPTPPKSAEEAVTQFFTAMAGEDCAWLRSVSGGRQAELQRLQTCDETIRGIHHLQPIRLLAIDEVTPNHRTNDEMLVRARYYGDSKERSSIIRAGLFDGVWKVVRF